MVDEKKLWEHFRTLQSHVEFIGHVIRKRKCERLVDTVRVASMWPCLRLIRFRIQSRNSAILIVGF